MESVVFKAPTSSSISFEVSGVDRAVAWMRLGLSFFLSSFNDVASPPTAEIFLQSQQYPMMEEHMWYQFDSYTREVSLLVLKAYAVSFLLLASVLLWTAGDLVSDACFFYSYSYLDSRHGRRLNYTFVDFG